ncbi:WD40 repeat-like protein [Phanerochaete sordida]|uniref:WD40 repeat-like protein n=1 Tax=Phanerochaete sordida TaxID=48140 RepID=A0A9P3GP08_9APHY|nr:WD40 repeat-like protein [Phanerochaete sordida]
MRVTDLAISQDSSKLVVVGMRPLPFPPVDHAGRLASSDPSIEPTSSNTPVQSMIGNQFVVYDLSSKRLELSVESEGALTSVRISQDSRYALLSRVVYPELRPVGEVHLCEMSTGRTVHKYTGHTQSRHVIRSGFGGQDEEFIISGCEGGRVHVWDRNSETPLAVLSGHGSGSVNSVAWNPTDATVFASCSDDHTTRIREVRST